MLRNRGIVRLEGRGSFGCQSREVGFSTLNPIQDNAFYLEYSSDCIENVFLLYCCAKVPAQHLCQMQNFHRATEKDRGHEYCTHFRTKNWSVFWRRCGWSVRC